MTDVVIRAEDLGKKYVIGHETKGPYTTLRDVLANQARRLLRSARDMASGQALITGDEREEFWALKNINFEVRRGEVVGIIGRNGAGKSTLLKVLSRITEPSEGRVTIDGRVASLIEVGTGFHPELTGRENIYLNGAILGMSRAEIRRKFEKIIDFAGVEKFIDTPVKRYSSGMYVRLAFSVAAHLEPDVLVVDEVLAVGDVEFQKKCLGKMQEVAGGGKTVLFVSHNLDAIQRLCSRGIMLNSGRTEGDRPLDIVLKKYFETIQRTTSAARYDNVLHVGSAKGPVKVSSLRLVDHSGLPVNGFRSGEDATIVFTLNEKVEVRRLRLDFGLRSLSGNPLFHCSTEYDSEFLERFAECKTDHIACRIPKLPLTSGDYLLSITLLMDGDVQHHIAQDLQFNIYSGMFFDNFAELPSNWQNTSVLVEQRWSAQSLT